ncbi:hypothetical protein SAMN02949497_1605 [Methylomagnum ishizawai]|uniref:Uncharacterized protein n=1 Tax=Methylomagnum ishizawai TaxID=1760988 RepID=A0A1Y6CVH6_9GAMM|nr:hypothetical protein [Methylomagnum ishizawai]SMF94296.1 hypothetical protein SAMN02949497_1605 [Methylomagnum ishizawai]
MSSKPFVDHMDIVVLTELLAGKAIESTELQARYGVSSIAPNLNRLRNRGLKVETTSRTATNGKKLAPPAFGPGASSRPTFRR